MDTRTAPTRSRRRWIPLLFAMIGSSLPVGCNDTEDPGPADPGPPPAPEHSGIVWDGEGATSIDLLGKRLRDSAIREDWSELLACLIPEDRAIIPFMAIVWAQGDEEVDPGILERLHAQFGIPTPEELEFDDENPWEMDWPAFTRKLAAAYQEVDLVALLAALETALEGHEDIDLRADWLYASGDISGVQQEGPMATGRIDEVPVKFRLIDDRWFVSVEVM